MFNHSISQAVEPHNAGSLALSLGWRPRRARRHPARVACGGAAHRTEASIDPWRVVALCVLLAGAETLHGIARTVLLAPRVGKARAIRWSVVSGTLLAYAIGWFAVPGVGATCLAQHLALGFGLALFMAAFDIAIGRLVMRLAWARIARDFDPRSGNLLSIGLALLVLMPAAVWWLRGAAPV